MSESCALCKQCRQWKQIIGHCYLCPPFLMVILFGPWMFSEISNVPAHNTSVDYTMSVITDRKSTNKDVSFMRSRSTHQLYIWNFGNWHRWNKSLHAWYAERVKPISVAPEIHAVVEPTNMVLNAFPITVTMTLLVCAWIASRAEIPVFTCPSSRPYCWKIIAVHTSSAA